MSDPSRFGVASGLVRRLTGDAGRFPRCQTADAGDQFHGLACTVHGCACSSSYVESQETA